MNRTDLEAVMHHMERIRDITEDGHKGIAKDVPEDTRIEYYYAIGEVMSILGQTITDTVHYQQSETAQSA